MKDAAVLWKASNKNINAQDTLDQELYFTVLRNASHVCRYFGPIPEIALESGWRGGQYRQLDPGKQREAQERSQYPGDWFVTAVEFLLRSDD